MQNKKIREASQQARVKLWEIAHELGITDATFSRKLRIELPKEEQQRILEIIQRIKSRDGAVS